MPSGNKSWFYRFSMNGKRQKMSLGKYPGIALKQARELHAKTLCLKEQGINPVEHAQQEKLKNDSLFVIPGISSDAPMSKDALPRAIKRIQKRVGIPEWTAHDLRRTFATRLGESLNINLVFIEKCLGHQIHAWL